MSFLGCIGRLMENSGLCETLQVVYGSNAVTHMLSGKELARARRGHFLVDAALNIILAPDAFQVPLPVLSMPGTETKVVDTEDQDSVEAAKEEMTERGSPFQSSESDGHSESVVVHPEEYQDSTQPNEEQITESVSLFQNGQSNGDCPAENTVESHCVASGNCGDIDSSPVDSSGLMKKTRETLDKLLSGDGIYEESRVALIEVDARLEEEKKRNKASRTDRLWLQYMKMVDILKGFLRAEKTGNWGMHLSSMKEMLPYFAAAGHNLYAKHRQLFRSWRASSHSAVCRGIIKFQNGGPFRHRK